MTQTTHDKGDGLTETVTLLNKTIQQRPFLSVAVAFGIGYVAMRVVRRRATS